MLVWVVFSNKPNKRFEYCEQSFVSNSISVVYYTRNLKMNRS